MDYILDYKYEPCGLLADSWGKTGPRTRVTRETAESNRFDLYLARTDTLRDALCYLRSLDDATLLAAVSRNSPEHAEIHRRIAAEIRPVSYAWLSLRCASAATDRGLLPSLDFACVTGY